MKTLVKIRKELQAAGRWDIDFHLPAEGVNGFPKTLLKRVDQVADIAKDKRDPGREPESSFQYIDIAAVDVAIGSISTPQDMEGSEAPSRARKVVRAFDVIVSTCRPTRGAIAVVPVRLHNQIASTAFSIVRPHSDINPFYLHYALRLPSTLEQLRKWSTGSSYPAILDSDVKKTLIPVPAADIQDAIAARVMSALRERAKVIQSADKAWLTTLKGITASLSGGVPDDEFLPDDAEDFETFSTVEIQQILKDLPRLNTDKNLVEADIELDLLAELSEAAD
jgi:type I restriction enzyme S subunit